MSKTQDESAEPARKLLTALYDQAVRAALPSAILKDHLPAHPKGRLALIAIGKAAASMTAAAEDHYPNTPLEGIALTRHGHGLPTRHVGVIEAGHPVPDAQGVDAATRIMAFARSLGADDFALVLISGGGSALATLPIDGVSLEDKQAITRALLTSGAPIHEINTVRKHLSEIKGGRLAAALHPARSLTLTISDVAGDDAAVVASGPTVPDPTTKDDALEILARRHINAAPHVIAAIKTADESPKPGDACFRHTDYKLIASGMGSLNAAAHLAVSAGYEVINLGDCIEGEARDVARAHAIRALDEQAKGRRVAILSGGELSVTFTTKAKGRGGPNQEYALALAIALNGAKGISALAGDTDGIDGGAGAASDPAGAIIDETTLARAHAAGIDPQAFLDAHDSTGFFSPLKDLLETGPSMTNVNDFRVILVERSNATI